MTAALHLAHVYQPPPGPKRKRKDGGGGGGEFFEFAKRIYGDDRADAQSRELLLAIAYAITTVAPDDGKEQWRTVTRALGPDRYGKPRARELVAHDAPCYRSPVYYGGRSGPDRDQLHQLCSAPRLRPYKEAPETMPGLNLLDIFGDGEAPAAPQEDFRNALKVCGSPAGDKVVEKLPGTGWHKVHWFCNRHRDHLLRVREQVREGNAAAPEPIPNRGGLLASYFDADFVALYQFYVGAHWEPPVYGIRADDWPIPGKEPVPMKARLRLASLDGELIGATS
jgi:hypothetical protein